MWPEEPLCVGKNQDPVGCGPKALAPVFATILENEIMTNFVLFELLGPRTCRQRDFRGVSITETVFILVT
jgi:hypothetical protein